MLAPINNIYNNNNYKLKPLKSKNKNFVDIKSMELMDYNSARAILTNYSVNFKGIAQPIETTHLYNKKVEGKDHLDLPNIHVYEFPDTNLKVFVNSEASIDNEDFLNTPQVIIKLSNEESNTLQKAIDLILEKKIKEISEDIVIIKEDNSTSYVDFLNPNPYDNVEKVNTQLFNLKIDNSDLEFLKSKNLNYSSKELEDYYQNIKKNYNLIMVLNIEKEDFSKNKKNILQSLNKGISEKLKNSNKEKKENIKNNFVNEIVKFKNKNITNIELNEIKQIYKNTIKEDLYDNYLPLMKTLFINKYEENIFNLYEIIDSISENDVMKLA